MLGYTNASKMPTLPYTELNYIQSTGTQYIDTGFTANQDTEVILDFELTALTSTWQGIISARDGSSGSYGSNFSFWVTASNTYRTDFGPDGGPMFGTATTTRKVLTKNKTSTTIGTDTTTTTSATFTCNYTLHLCTGWSGGSQEYAANMKVYSLKIYDNGTLSCDFVPVMRNSDSVVGLYDKVSKTFFTNAGTGTFLYG